MRVHVIGIEWDGPFKLCEERYDEVARGN